MIEWFAKNHVAANLLMFGIMLAGVLSIRNEIPFEVMPDFKLGSVTITTFLPGGNPQSIEETITTRIEEAIVDIEGIKDITSRSSENLSSVIAQVDSGYDEQIVLSDIKVRIDALSTLPRDAERPIIQIATVPIQVVGLAIYGDNPNYDDLYQASADVREALLQVDGITQVGELQAPPREIHIEVTPQTLEQFNLTLEDIGLAIRRNSIDISAGNLRTIDGDILVRTNGQAYTAKEYRVIPITNSGDRVVYLGDIATVIDGYDLTRVESSYNGKPTITVETYRIGKQNTIEISKKVHQFIADYSPNLPTGIHIGTYGDTANLVNSRLNTLINSAMYGGLLVMILLSLFLRPAVAMWVGLGIPMCFLGAFAVMPYFGLSMNMLTMFAFILVLGIVVDDAIVTGENIYRHMRNGMPSDKAAIFGTHEVAVPVTFGVITTMVAFAPLLFVEGFLGTFAKQIPLVVIPVLAFSLIESKLILPSHMSRIKTRDENKISFFSTLQLRFSRGFENAILNVYRPFLHRCINNKTITMVSAAMIFVLSIALMSNGWLKTSFFPEFEDDAIYVSLSMPPTTGYETTKKHIDHINDVASELAKKHINPITGKSIFKYSLSVSGMSFSDPTSGPSFGTNSGFFMIEVEPSTNRPPKFSLKNIQKELREMIGDIPGSEKLSLSSSFSDFGRPLSISIYGNDLKLIREKVSNIRQYLKTYPGVFDIRDNVISGKEEIQLEITPLANSLGLSLSNISSQVRQAVYGFEAQRIQRGHDELKVMVRYPLEYRSSITDVMNMPIRVANSNKSIPLSQLAELKPVHSPSAVYHDDLRRAVTVSADINTQSNDVNIIRKDLSHYLDELFQYAPNIEYSIDGQAETQEEANQSFLLGFVVVLLLIYALLAIPFKSFSQPLIVMSIIPLAIVGAIIGHIVMGLAFSMLSIMGILALTGIVVNDSLVLVDYINKQRLEGGDIMEAVLTAGEVRFRPVMLTSLTTFVGLLPLMMSSDSQSQTLVPMAVSLGFGILFATLITLIIIPVNYLIFHKLGQYWHGED